MSIESQKQDLLNKINSVESNLISAGTDLAEMRNIIAQMHCDNPQPPDPPDPPQPTSKVSISGKNFVWNGQKALFIFDTAWSLLDNLTDAEIKYYIDTRRAQGFNGIIFSMNSSQIQTGGGYSFLESHMNRAKGVLDYLASLGMWGFIGMSGVIYRNGVPVDAIPYEHCHELAKSFTQSLSSYSNIPFVFLDALDAHTVNGQPVPNPIKVQHAKELCRGAKDGDPSRLVVPHPRHGKSSIDSAEGFPIGSSHDFPVLHSGHSSGKVPSFVQGMYSTARDYYPNLPILNIEPCYVGYNGVTEANVKQIAYIDQYNGPSIVNGHIDVAVFTANWKNALQNAGARYVVEAGRRMGTPTVFG